MKSNFIESTLAKQDFSFEVPLRPQSLSEFLGQDEVRERLSILIGAAKQRGEALGHCLLSGPPGLGKTTLAAIIAKEMQTSLIVTSGPVLEKPGDLAGILTNLQPGDILFIDEIHRINRSIEEYLYPAMEDYALDVLIDSGPSARTVHIQLNRFTLIGATTRSGFLTAPLRSRFALNCRLDYYTSSVLELILRRSSRLLNLEIDLSALQEIAGRSRGTPRIANHLLRWVRDFAQVRGHLKITQQIARGALELLAIDERGLDEMDKKLLSVIIDHYRGGPVGLNTLAVAVGEEGKTIEEVYEPFLILLGFITRTPRGRLATDLAYAHLGKSRQP